MIFNTNSKEYQLYFHYIKSVSSLSKLFSESDIPFLHYRLAENLFCKAFNAENLSRTDTAYDAKIDNIGIGIKTFVCPSNSKTEKIAEFDRKNSELKNLNVDKFVIKLSELRNERINFSNRTYKIEKSYYHCIARKKSALVIFNTNYDLVNIDKINIISKDNASVKFKDDINEYSYNYAKSTLFKKFIIPQNHKTIDIQIIDNPLDLILKIFNEYNKFEITETKDFVILPLYSYDKNKNENKKYVPEKSGLNQWNAGGRVRKYGEVYIPIPAEIRKLKIGFFPERDKIFNLEIPSGIKLKAKICQDNGKALMTNPNIALANWLLKDVLQLKERELLTYKKLEIIGIDSVKVEKIDDENYKIYFSKIGSYENFLLSKHN